jgi:hypothetical protein
MTENTTRHHVAATVTAVTGTLSELSRPQAWRLVAAQSMQLRHGRGPVPCFQDDLLARAIPAGVWGPDDAAEYHFVRMAAEARAEELLPPRARPLFVYAVIATFAATAWSDLAPTFTSRHLLRRLTLAWRWGIGPVPAPASPRS